MANTSLKRVYYKARNNMQINRLPFFFGWVDFLGQEIAGRHYKPKIEKSTGAYIIGYYKITGPAADFSQTFNKYGLLEISEEDFNILLSQWTGGGEYAPSQWGLVLNWEIAKAD